MGYLWYPCTQRCILTAHYVPWRPLRAPPPMVRVPAAHGMCPRCPQYMPTPCAATHTLTCHWPVAPVPCHSTLAADCTAADASRPSQRCHGPTGHQHDASRTPHIALQLTHAHATHHMHLEGAPRMHQATRVSMACVPAT